MHLLVWLLIVMILSAQQHWTTGYGLTLDYHSQHVIPFVLQSQIAPRPYLMHMCTVKVERNWYFWIPYRSTSWSENDKTCNKTGDTCKHSYLNHYIFYRVKSKINRLALYIILVSYLRIQSKNSIACPDGSTEVKQSQRWGKKGCNQQCIAILYANNDSQFLQLCLAEKLVVWNILRVPSAVDIVINMIMMYCQQKCCRNPLINKEVFYLEILIKRVNLLIWLIGHLT